MRTCKWCGERYKADRQMQVACSPSCALGLARVKAEAKRKKEHRKAREAVKPISKLKAEAQAAFNAWIRERDFAKPCVSCGRSNDGMHQRHAGHYRTVGANPALRFEPDNVHAQCSVCNNHLSGNLVAYRAELIRRIGLERVEWLEGPHEPAKFTREELAEMKREYSAKVRAMRKERGGDAV